MADYGGSNQGAAMVVAVATPVVETPPISQLIRYVDEYEAQTDAINEQLKDRDYKDGHQWTKQEIAALNKSHQPVITKNRIQKKILSVVGEEINRRTAPEAFPRTPQHGDGSKAATDALRFVCDEQRFDAVRTEVAEDICVEGVGGSYKSVERMSNGRVKHKLIRIPFRRLGYDPHSIRPDFSDALYTYIATWFDLAEAIRNYPDKEHELRNAITSWRLSNSGVSDDKPTQWIDSGRMRVKVVEMYMREGDEHYRVDFVYGSILREMERCYIEDEEGKSVCPLNMMSCFVDQEGRRYGLVRAMRSPQDILNKTTSKYMNQINTKDVIAEEDSIPDPTTFMNNLHSPDRIAFVATGRLRDNSIQIRDEANIAPAQIALMQDAQMSIDGIGPQEGASSLPDSVSGRAILARKADANTEVALVFDKISQWTLQQFRLDWWCVRKYWTDAMWLRVKDTEAPDGYRHVQINRQMTRKDRALELAEKKPPVPPEKILEIAAGNVAPVIAADLAMYLQQYQQQAEMAMQMSQAQGMPPPQIPQPDPMQLALQHPLMQQVITVDQMDQLDVDIILTEVPDTATVEQEEFAKLADIVPSIAQAVGPKLAQKMYRDLVKFSTFRNNKEYVAAMEEGPSEEEIQQQQASLQLQIQQTTAQIATLEAQAAYFAAKAQESQAAAQAKIALTPSEIKENEAQAVKDMAQAGEKIGGFNGPLQ